MDSQRSYAAKARRRQVNLPKKHFTLFNNRTKDVCIIHQNMYDEECENVKKLVENEIKFYLASSNDDYIMKEEEASLFIERLQKLARESLNV
ncbi:hypothetical protein CYMTET_40462 [Cymbomonas tetramitiformis]|uniref:Uncharacterized protein n=1 Tax=Cymbomonas tetramitiformis TaxID=36881 RepID=A0AAE0C813_9CHLO|nr:hypothetical protein CYMTET_40462 [Cymbomonas tetramitiformis]